MKTFKYYSFVICLFMISSKSYANTEEQQINSITNLNAETSWKFSSLNLTTALDYQSNIDLLDEKIYSNIYKDVLIFNLGGKIAIIKNLFLGELTYKPSIDLKLMEANHYVTNQDQLRNFEINQGFYLKHPSSTEKLSWGPTFDLNYRKYYTYGGWRRVRDYASALIGYNVDYSPIEKMSINASAKVGYLDHYGIYVNPNEPSRANEKNLQEDRIQYKGSLTTVYSFSEKTTISLPFTFSIDDYSEKKARAGNDRFDRDMLKFNLENNLPYSDPTLNLQKASAGIDVSQIYNSFEAILSYSFTDIKELNDGQGRNNADDSIVSTNLTYHYENYFAGLEYSYETYKFQNLVGGAGLEITNTYGVNLKLNELFKKTNFKLSLNRTHGSYWYHDGWTEKPTNDSISIQLNRLF